MLKSHYGNRKIKNPRWNQILVQTDKAGYLYIDQLIIRVGIFTTSYLIILRIYTTRNFNIKYSG